MRVAIIDYQSGNLRSAQKSFERAAATLTSRQEIIVTADPEIVASADRVVLPGVGAFADCRHGVAPMLAALEEAVIRRGKPFLGICVGMQLMASRGLEHETVEGFNWLAGDVRGMTPGDTSLKIPHMGWNQLIKPDDGHPVLAGIETGAYVYFVHSYAFFPTDQSSIKATVDYGGPVSAVVGRDNLVGTQFHPEKSQQIGLQLISNFLQWSP